MPFDDVGNLKFELCKLYLWIRLKMVFTKDDLAVIVTCFTEKGWTGTLNPLDYSTWDILQELVYEGRREPFANLRDFQNVIRDNGMMLMIRQ